MDIVLKGSHSGEELIQSLQSVVRLFNERYHVPAFNDVHLVVSLLDESGQEVELVDSQTSAIYRIFEVQRENQGLRGANEKKRPALTLVVDHTR